LPKQQQKNRTEDAFAAKYSGALERSPEKETTKSVLEEILRKDVRKLLQAVIENEMEE